MRGALLGGVPQHGILVPISPQTTTFLYIFPKPKIDPFFQILNPRYLSMFFS